MAVASFLPLTADTEWIENMNKFFLQSFTNVYDFFTKYGTPQGKIISLKLSDVLKLSLKQTKLYFV